MGQRTPVMLDAECIGFVEEDGPECFLPSYKGTALATRPTHTDAVIAVLKYALRQALARPTRLPRAD